MDALFIIDEEYSTFPEAWKALHRLFELTGLAAEIVAEPLRLTFSGRTFRPPSPEPDSIGRHYAGEPNGDFLRATAQQSEALIAGNIPFRIRNEPTGDAHSLELRYDGKESPRIVVPFDDTPEKARGFFEHYRRILESKKKFSVFGKSPTPWRIHERMETVGRHEILQAFEIFHPSGDIGSLLSTLRSFFEIQREKSPIFYFQFFAPPSFTTLSMPEDALYEITYQYSRISYAHVEKIIAQAPAVTDTFSIFEQKNSRIDQPCSTTYTLRKTKMGVYEIRVNAVWKAEIDPEAAVSSLETQTGVAWARIA